VRRRNAHSGAIASRFGAFTQATFPFKGGCTMSSYILCLIASLAFYPAGILMITSGNNNAGIALIALGCIFFAIALNRRKKQK